MNPDNPAFFRSQQSPVQFPVASVNQYRKKRYICFICLHQVTLRWMTCCNLTDEYFMNEALEQARLAAAAGEVPVGCVAVAGQEVIARNHNRIEMEKDAAAHAEMLVLRETCRILDRWRLDDVTLYVTIEPCPMCAMAMIFHRICRVVYGATEPKTGAAGSFLNLLQNPDLNHRVRVTPGVADVEAAEIMKAFFQKRRVGKAEV